jgi:hypothetical protein
MGIACAGCESSFGHVQVAAPEGRPNQTLRELAVKLVTLVAGGPFSAAFQSAVASLPPEAKQRLQVRGGPMSMSPRGEGATACAIKPPASLVFFYLADFEAAKTGC